LDELLYLAEDAPISVSGLRQILQIAHKVLGRNLEMQLRPAVFDQCLKQSEA